jgi:tRNA nucleotidyltransferase (CCA-adding enzyme)
VAQEAGGAAAFGPAPVLLELTVNGKKVTTNVEPRVTLLDALRNYLDVTGCKRVCDRGTCGACTVMIDGRTVYSCTMLAVEARGAEIKTAESLGMAVHLVGGAVRDLLLGRASPDLDLVVEGDGIAFAARLAEEVGGRLVSHPAFGTASIEGARALEVTALGRIDVASARRERYEAPGQLPRVEPASIAEDLRRRDFSVNAMAVALAPARFGRLSDPFGGQGDLRRRWLRPLHPLSFVEDPTRIFRAARYGARLGFRLPGAGRQALATALRASALSRGFPALSGARLAAELRLIAGEETGWLALERLADRLHPSQGAG